MQRYYRGKKFEGYQEIISEDDQLLNYLAFGKLTLKAGHEYVSRTNGYEVALVILSGKATISSENQSWEHLGGRQTVFENRATTVYVPCQSEYSIQAETDIQVGVCKVKAEEKFKPFVVWPDDVVHQQRGKETWRRDVYDVLADNANGKVQRIVLGETINRRGNWSGYPPHKHDGEFFPEEPKLEEVYHFQLNPEQGIGVQLHYTKDNDINDAYLVKHGDSFAIDKGYHPVGSTGGYEVYYLWFMAGETGRELKPYEDPDHKWLNS